MFALTTAQPKPIAAEVKESLTLNKRRQRARKCVYITSFAKIKWEFNILTEKSPRTKTRVTPVAKFKAVPLGYLVHSVSRLPLRDKHRRLWMEDMRPY